MRVHRSGLLMLGLLLFVLTACRSRSSRRGELFRYPGSQWLSWTAGEREDFVYGYLAGHGDGVDEACLATDRLFETHKRHILGQDGNVPSALPSVRCLASVAQYPNVKFDASKGPDFSAYTIPITDFYTEHPEYRGSPITLLMESLAGPKQLTGDDIYKKWTTWRSPPRH